MVCAIVVEITIKMKTIVRKPFKDKNLHASPQNFRQLDCFNQCDLTLIILFNIDHLFAHSEVVTTNAI